MILARVPDRRVRLSLAYLWSRASLANRRSLWHTERVPDIDTPKSPDRSGTSPPDRSENTQTPTRLWEVRTPPADGSGHRHGLAYRLSELLGMVPLLAPLAAAGWYQADLAADMFGWTWPWLVVWPAAIEGGAAYAATLYLRKLVAGHSTVGTRLGMVVYASGSSALLVWHALGSGKPWQAAAAIGCMTLAAVWIWGQRSRWLRRADLQRRGLVDAQAPRFNVLRWLACPVETPRAFRHAVKMGISDPQSALDSYRSERTRRRTARALARARKAARERARERSRTQPAKNRPDPTPRTPKADSVKPSRKHVRRTPAPGNVRSLRSAADDQTAVDALRQWRVANGRTPSINEVQRTVGGGRSRAVRLRSLLMADRSDDQEGEAAA